MTDVVYGRHPVAEALRAAAGIEKVWIAEGLKAAEILDEIRRLAADAGVETIEVPRSQIDSLAPSSSHQGVVAEARPYRYASFDDLLRDARARLMLLDGVTDPQNLGAIMRSAHAFGFTGVLLPRRRSAAVTPATRRVAAGAAEHLGVAQVGSAASTVDRLKKKGVTTFGLAAEAGTPYDQVGYPPAAICIVLGSEGEGLSHLTAQRCDQLISIPMAEGAESLNVAAAAAVAAAEVARTDRRHGSGDRR